MVSGLDNVSLLTALLAAQKCRPSVVGVEDALLVQCILAIAPKSIRPQRKSNLFEAIHILDLENPHSDFLAWLLDPLGPLTGNWLLRSLLEKVAPHASCDGEPIVNREYVVDEGRLDILLDWSSFKLIIENKTWSQEGDHQVARYLSSCAINDPSDGCIIYLSPYGERPHSVGREDTRVVAMSYDELGRLIENGLDSGKEINFRGRAFAAEFRDCIPLLLKVRYDPTMPEISESSKIYIGHGKRLAEIRALAIDEFSIFLKWMYGEGKRRLKPIVGSELILNENMYGAIFRLPNWIHDGVVFGFDFGTDCDPSRTLLSEKGEGPWLGVGAWRSDGTSDKPSCQALTQLLAPEIAKVWAYKDDLRDAGGWGALWREFKIPEDGDIQGWSETVLKFLDQLAATLTPVLNVFAESLSHDAASIR